MLFRSDAVAEHDGLLVAQVARSRLHVFRKEPDHVVLPAVEEELGAADILGIVRGVDQAGAGRGAQRVRDAGRQVRGGGLHPL